MTRLDRIVRGTLIGAIALAGCGATKPSRDEGTGGASGAAGFAGSPGTGGFAGGDAGGGGNAGASVVVGPVPNLTGAWAMFGFEDPVAVDMGQRDGVLAGIGCYAGLPQPFSPSPCSQIVDGTIIGRHAEFAFEVKDFGQVYRYAADVITSAAGDRMTGRFHGTAAWHAPTAWLRIDRSRTWLSVDADPGLRAAVEVRARGYDLILSAGSQAGQEFERDRVYKFALLSYVAPMIISDLGAFWGTEMSWQDQDQTLVVGPVSATAPDLAVGLRLRFNGLDLGEVEATDPSGARYLFHATAATSP